MRSAGPSLQPELALVRLAPDEFLPGPVRLRNHLQGVRPVQGLLVIAEGVEGLAVRRLVPPEPLADAGDDAGALRLHVLDVAQLRRQRVGDADGDDLPIELAVIDHGKRAQYLHARHLALRKLPAANLDHVERVVVSLHVELPVDLRRVLPSLRKEAVVPEDRSVVVPQLAGLDVLSDRVHPLLRVDLVLGRRHLRDLGDHPHLRRRSLARV
mmetsp:Transcript_97967/g.272576  ORF Transcript_97967/g.272576 Transcript_97967/m.272576 type:complete len:212 (-) Transcript_97967:394-1029(-)